MNEKDCALILFSDDNQDRKNIVFDSIKRIINGQVFFPNIYCINEGEKSIIEIPDNVNIVWYNGDGGKYDAYNSIIDSLDEKYLCFIDYDIITDDEMWMLKIFDMVSRNEKNIVQVYDKIFLDDSGNSFKSMAVDIDHGSTYGGFALSKKILKNKKFNVFDIFGVGWDLFVAEHANVNFNKYNNNKWWNNVIKSTGEAELCHVDSIVKISDKINKNKIINKDAMVYGIDIFGPIDESVNTKAFKDYIIRESLHKLNEDEVRDIAFDCIFSRTKIDEEVEIMDDTALITCFYGNDNSILNASKISFDKLMNLTPRPYIVMVELLKNGSDSKWSELDSIDGVSHVKINLKKKNFNLWQKESAYNIGARSIDLNKYKYLIFHDADSYPVNSNWAGIIRKTMIDWNKKYKNDLFMIQNFSTFRDCIDKFLASGYVYFKNFSNKNEDVNMVNPGLSWTMFSSFFQKSGGFFIKSVTGSADRMLPVRWDESLSIDGVEFYKRKWPWVKNLIKNEKKHEYKVAMSYMPIELIHVYHGHRKTNRAYVESRSIINCFCNKVEDLIYEDSNGLVAWNDENHILSRFVNNRKKELTEFGIDYMVNKFIFSKETKLFNYDKIVYLSQSINTLFSKFISSDSGIFKYLVFSSPSSLSNFIDCKGINMFVGYKIKSLKNNNMFNNKQCGTVLYNNYDGVWSHIGNVECEDEFISKMTTELKYFAEMSNKNKERVLYISDINVKKRDLKENGSLFSDVINLKSKLEAMSCSESEIAFINYDESADKDIFISTSDIPNVYIVTIGIDKNLRFSNDFIAIHRDVSNLILNNFTLMYNRKLIDGLKEKFKIEFLEKIYNEIINIEQKNIYIYGITDYDLMSFIVDIDKDKKFNIYIDTIDSKMMNLFGKENITINNDMSLYVDSDSVVIGNEKLDFDCVSYILDVKNQLIEKNNE